MARLEQLNIPKSICRFSKVFFSNMLVAFMLGMSNVILEEERMVNDTREHIELQEIADEEDLHDSKWSSEVF